MVSRRSLFQSLLCCLMTTLALITWQANQATAQPSDGVQGQIRAALTKWAADFNTGNAQEACELFSRDLLYDYRGVIPSVTTTIFAIS